MSHYVVGMIRAIVAGVDPGAQLTLKNCSHCFYSPKIIDTASKWYVNFFKHSCSILFE